MSSLELKVCPNGHRVYVNPLKHQNRTKLCPKCRGKLSTPRKDWKPNLKWLKTRIYQRQERGKRRQRRKEPDFMFPLMGLRRGWRPSTTPAKPQRKLTDIGISAEEAQFEVDVLAAKQKHKKDGER